MKPKLSVASAGPAIPLGPEEVDIDSRGTFDVSRRGRWRDTQSSQIEPAWFVPREKGLARLSRRLLSESSPTSWSVNKTATFRLAAILDWQTEVVHLVSVYHSCGVVRVTRFSDEFGRVYTRRVTKSIALAEVLGVTMPDGRRRFEVIGSARTKAPTEFYLQTFRNRREFREQFAGPVMEAQRAVQSGAMVTQLRMEAFGVQSGASCQTLTAEDHSGSQDDSYLDYEVESAELDCQDEQCEDDSSKWPMTEAYTNTHVQAQGRLALTGREVMLLLELPSFTPVDELACLIAARHPDGRLVIRDALYEVIEKIAALDVTFFTMAEEIGIGQALEAYGY